MNSTDNIPSVNDNTSGINPCGHRVLVYPLPVERKTASGILIPDKFSEREDMAQIKAVVIECGPTAWLEESKDWAEPGDTVLIAKYSGLYYDGVDGKHYRVINDHDVVAIVNGVNPSGK